jgi:dTDP-4-dehydrorhamnose 3,5-epimerase
MDELDKIKIFNLEKILLEGGDIIKVFKKSVSGNITFEEIYFSSIDFNFIKGWKMHKKMTMNLMVPSGEVEFLFVTKDFKNSKKIIIGEFNNIRVQVPPNIWFCFKGLSEKLNLVLNLASIEHDPDEIERLEINNFPIKIQ